MIGATSLRTNNVYGQTMPANFGNANHVTENKNSTMKKVVKGLGAAALVTAGACTLKGKLASLLPFGRIAEFGKQMLSNLKNANFLKTIGGMFTSLVQQVKTYIGKINITSSLDKVKGMGTSLVQKAKDMFNKVNVGSLVDSAKEFGSKIIDKVKNFRAKP